MRRTLVKLKKNKLLIVGAFPPAGSKIYGGIVTTCRTLLDSSFAENFDLILIDSTQISNPPPNLGVRLVLAIKRFFRFMFLFFSEKPNAVLLFTAVGASVLEKGAMAWVARTKTIPVFLFPRGAELIDTVNASAVQKVWVKAALLGATHLLCQGPAWQRFATDVLGFKKSNAPIVLNWSATTALLELGATKAAGSQSLSNPTFLFLGWLEKEKGIFELLDACLDVSKLFQFRLVIAGRGRAEQEARDFVFANCLQDCVEFVGWVQGADKDDLLKKADVLILPSWGEGFPNAIIEAMAAKVAVVVTSVGNVPDLITDREEALLIPPKDSAALRRALELLLRDAEFRRRLAETGHIFAQENFSVEKGGAKLALTIEQAIECRGR